MKFTKFTIKISVFSVHTKLLKINCLSRKCKFFHIVYNKVNLMNFFGTIKSEDVHSILGSEVSFLIKIDIYLYFLNF